jgi:hypothetical protein
LRNKYGFCKETEICKPFKCRKAICPIGEELRSISNLQKCGEICLWIKNGINGADPCKDSSCPIGNTIVEFRKDIPKTKNTTNIL